MRFTRQQYEKAIVSLQDAMQQLEPDGHICACCGDSGHQAFECGFNPLVAMAICRDIAKQSEQLHDTLHFLSGCDFRMGQMIGPAAVHPPEDE